MEKFLFSAVLLFLSFSFVQAQESTSRIDLVRNGDFEAGNTGFKSDFKYNKNSTSPGYYSLTTNASSLNRDYRDPVKGDHTFGDGYFLVVDSDNIPGKRAWYTTVDVIPNSNYTFSLYFCNLFRHKGTDKGFVINGLEPESYPKLNDCKIRFLINNVQVGETEVDIFHMYQWLSASVTWYSGTSAGKVEIAIENENHNAVGNDLALDDVEFVYIETMPPGYKPPEKNTVLAKKISQQADPRFQLAELRKAIQAKARQQAQGDSIAPGIYTIKPRKEKRTFYSEVLYFSQSQSELLPQTLLLLDSIAAWMKEEPRLKIALEGHTDNQGDPKLNIKLSEERVHKIKQYLIYKGIDASRIHSVGYGGGAPRYDNSSEETRKLNRRVEIKISEE